LNYICQPHKNWNLSTPVSNVDYKHSDTDGNSTIDDNDTLAIAQNWGLIHLRPNPSESIFNLNPTGFYVDYDTTYPGSSISLPIILGDAINVQDSAYGLTYTIFYDNTLVEPGSVSVSFDSSWIGSLGSDMITVSKDFYNNGQIQVGMSRTNLIPRSGFGRIGNLNMTIKNNLNFTGAYQRLIMGIGQITFIDNTENNVSIIPQPTFVTILPNITSVINNEIFSTQIFPNPANDLVNIVSKAEILKTRLFSYTGQLINEYCNVGNSQTINTSNLNDGLYLIDIYTSEGVINSKIVIQK
jgi:hypothetical protein